MSSGVNDGVAIDNLRFSAAVPEPTGVAVLALAWRAVAVGRFSGAVQQFGLEILECRHALSKIRPVFGALG